MKLKKVFDRKNVPNDVEALQQQGDLFEVIISSIGDAVIATDINAKITVFNPIAEKLTGWTAQEALGRKITEVIHLINEQTRETVENPIDCVLKEGLIVGLADHTVLITRDGREIPIDDSGAPIRNKEGVLLGVVFVFRDITERKQTERVIQEARDYAENIVETVREPLVVLDADLHVVSANRVFYQTFQVTAEESKNQLFFELGDRQWDNPRLRELLEEILLQQTTFEAFEVEHDFKTIGPKTMLLNARQIRREANQVQLILLAFEDITERKQAEEKLKNFSERLEEIVKQRTRELRKTQEKLLRKEKLAVLGQLVGGIGHELRNPLSTINNTVFFLKMVLVEPEEEVMQSLDALENSVTRSMKTLNSLLDFIRPKSFRLRKTDINDVIHTTLSHITVPEMIKVVIQLEKTLPFIFADPDQLSHVFENIITNAIQAMPEGGQLLIKSVGSSPQWVEISITDSGVGMPQEVLEQLFEPLFTTKAKGIGLGLAMSKMLVEGHGGTIEVESKVGKGSTFIVRLHCGRREQK